MLFVPVFIQVEYKEHDCKGDIVYNSTFYYPWSNLGECQQVNDDMSIIQQCVKGEPVAQIWYADSYLHTNCKLSPNGNTTYNQCSPPGKESGENSHQLKLLINPCTDQ